MGGVEGWAGKGGGGAAREPGLAATQSKSAVQHDLLQLHCRPRPPRSAPHLPLLPAAPQLLLKFIRLSVDVCQGEVEMLGLRVGWGWGGARGLQSP